VTHPLRGKIAVTGIGTTPGWDNPGLNAMDQLAVAVHAACQDCGINVKDIDGLFAGSLTHAMPALSAAEYLGLQPRILEGTNIGGSSFIAYLLQAMLALDAGLCSVACICYGSDQRSAGGKLLTLTEPSVWEAPYRPRNPISGYALAAARHMYEFGTTPRQLAEVAVAARAWAQRNPMAFVRDPLSIEQALATRPISDPLKLSDCCLVTDGGGAVILMRADRARDMRQQPVHVLGVGMATTHRSISAMPDLTTTAAVQSGQRAYEMSGLSAADVDVAEIYDAFTINTILFLEDLGFCRKGEGGSFVENGAIAPGGRLPVNTNGGGLSCCHPGMYGVFTIIEAVAQLRGGCRERQVEGAEIALAHGNGGQLSSQVTALFGTPETI
jgi:acetyl-CoA acetyltransferase